MAKSIFFLFIILAILTSCKQQNTIATVEHNSEGCFGGSNSKLIIYRQDDETMAECTENSEQPYTAKLNQLQIDSFYKFVKQLKKQTFTNDCTTKETYIVYIEDIVIEKNDGSCNWRGFDNLKKYLFPGVD